MKPKSLLLVLILGWIAVGVTAIVALIGLISILRASSYTYYGQTSGLGTAWVFWVLELAAIAVLATGQFMVTQQRKDLGRWLFVGGAGSYLLVQIVGMALYGGGGAVDILLFIIALALMVGTAVFLFMPDMNAWLGKPGLSNMMSGYGGQPAHPGHAQPGQTQPGGYNPQATGWSAQPAQFPPQPQSQPLSGHDHAPPTGHSHAAPSDFTQPTGYPPVSTPGETAATGGYAPQLAVGESAAQPTGAMRTCPYCAEQIRAEAVKCRYCGSEVTPTA